MNTKNYYYFKGERTYIQSGNIFDDILAKSLTVSPTHIDFKLSRITKKMWYLVTDKNLFSADSIIGQYKDDTTELFILESDQDVSERQPYDEDGLIRDLGIDTNKAKVPDGLIGFSFIEKANAAFKTLLKQSVCPEKRIHYVFVRLTLDHIPADGFTIRYRRTIAEKFYEGEIIEFEVVIGNIYFSGEN